MLRKILRTVSAFGLLLASGSIAMGQVVQTTQATTQPAGGAPATLHAKSIMGASVSIQGGTGIGTVQDFVLNDDGVVEYLIVAEGGKLVTVPWEAAKFNHEKRVAVINITQEQYRQIPTYTVSQYPNFYTPEYRTQVYRYYGLTPGRERRLERRDDRKP